jgi:hypothetical protein
MNKPFFGKRVKSGYIQLFTCFLKRGNNGDRVFDIAMRGNTENLLYPAISYSPLYL